MGMRTLKPNLFIDVLIEKVKLIKEIFLNDIEDGVEVFIPKDLS